MNNQIKDLLLEAWEGGKDWMDAGQCDCDNEKYKNFDEFVKVHENKLKLYTIDELITFINKLPVMIPVEDFFDSDGLPITKQEYGRVVIKYLCEELKEKYN